MKTDIQTLQDLFKISYEAFEQSRIEEKVVRDMYHNRQYSDEQLAILERRGQPAETFNIIKLFARLLVGYYSTVVNTVKVSPQQESDTLTAMLLHDVVQYTFEQNHFETEGDKVKLDGMLAGLMCVYEDVVDTGKVDNFGRPIRRIELSHVPSREILLDPMSTKDDYSDARYIHRFKWVSEDYLVKMLKDQKLSTSKIEKLLNSLDAYSNHVNQNDTEFEAYYTDRFVGYYKQYDNYLLVHSIVEEGDKVWSIYWSGEEILFKKEVTYKEVKFPYRVQKIHSSDRTEYYGLFREVVETQKAINQALIKIQLMANSQKAFIQDGAVEDIDEFVDAFNRVNAVIPVKKLAGVKVENLNREVLEQYAIVDKGFDRIQRVLGVNDSFLGNAYASDSGRKVKLQQNATTLALRYVTTKIEQLYRLVGWDIVNLAKQFYTASETLKITDESTGQRWAQINTPMQIWTGQISPNGQPIMDFVYEEVLDPESQEPLIDKDGNYVIAPIPEQETEIAFSEVDLSIDSTAYNDEDEKNQLMLESILQGSLGNTLLQFNPAAYLKVASLSIKSVRTKHSHTIADIFEQTANSIAGSAMAPIMQQEGQQPRSQELKLPQNTNEGQ